MADTIINQFPNNNLFNSIRGFIEESRNMVVKHVNTYMVFTYYHIGRIIVEHEQGGEERALYSQKTLKHLSTQLIKEYGKGYSVDNLEKFRRFYLVYNSKISESMIRKSPGITFSAFQEIFRLSWTHYFHLLKIQNELERNFYELEALNNNWSIREMQRQFNSSLYERLALSRDKNAIQSLSMEGQIVEAPIDASKSPYVLEFLNLREIINIQKAIWRQP